MFSLETIRRLNDQATRRARHAHKAPRLLNSPETAWDDLRHAPFVGDHRSPAWDTLDPQELPAEVLRHLWRPEDAQTFLFVDTTGWGRDTEPALSVRQQQEVAAALARWSEENGWHLGAYIVEVGQFQAVIEIVKRRRPGQPLRKAG